MALGGLALHGALGLGAGQAAAIAQHWTLLVLCGSARRGLSAPGMATAFLGVLPQSEAERLPSVAQSLSARPQPSWRPSPMEEILSASLSLPEVFHLCDVFLRDFTKPLYQSFRSPRSGCFQNRHASGV